MSRRATFVVTGTPTISKVPDDGDAFASTGDASEFEVLTMVLENGPYGPMMCLTGALMTLPPKGGDTRSAIGTGRSLRTSQSGRARDGPTGSL